MAATFRVAEPRTAVCLAAILREESMMKMKIFRCEVGDACTNKCNNRWRRKSERTGE